MKIKGKYTEALITTEDIESSCISQIYEMTSHPAATNPITIMPDCHSGKGCVIGFTMKMGDKVVPNWVGVDIGCGMQSTLIEGVNFDKKLLKKIDNKIRDVVPLGCKTNDDYSQKTMNRFYLMVDNEMRNTAFNFGFYSRQWLDNLIIKTGIKEDLFWGSLGSLGGGNHFIEIGKGSEGENWLTIHCGSRNFGKRVCDYFDKIAQESLKIGDSKEYIKSLKEKVAAGEISNSDIGPMLKKHKEQGKADFNVKKSSYLTGKDKDQYLAAMIVAQTYAKLNRTLITEAIVKQIPGIKTGKTIDTPHNYISPKDGIIRKGAISSYENELMIIPFNMRDGLLICHGKSNSEWNFSAPHGAGRVFSRSQAKKDLSVDKYREQMKGIFSTSVNKSTLDESPDAYKDAELIEILIEDTAKILTKVKPLYNLKAGDKNPELEEDFLDKDSFELS